MTTEKIDRFWDWVEGELSNRGMSYHRLEKMGEVSNATVSRPARLRTKPTLTVIEAIARGFQLTKVRILAEAGVIESITAGELSQLELAEIISGLSPEGRARVTAHAAWTLSEEKAQGGSGDTSAEASGDAEGNARAE